MKCPACPESVLMMTERSGVEIDYCPTCRGVWLDRGELDKLIERTAPAAVAAQAPMPAAAPAPAAQPHPAQPHPAQPHPAQPHAAQPYPAQDRPQKRWYDDDDDDDDWDERRRNDGHRPDGYKYKKKNRTKSLLGEIFDF